MTTSVAFGVDYASYQAGENLTENKGEGFAFAFLKATQGVGYIDPYYAGWAKNPGGLTVEAYHYLDRSDWAAQAAFFHSVVGDTGMMMADMERGGPINGSEGKSSLHAMQDQGYETDLYLPHWYWLLMGSPNLQSWGIRNLIASDYPSSMPGYAYDLYPGDSYKGWNDYGGIKPDILQFTDAARVGGQLVDADAATSMKIFLTQSQRPPVPTPQPIAPPGWVETVHDCQVSLNRWPFSAVLAEDNVDGSETDAALRRFQKAARIADDGVDGPITHRRLVQWYDPNRVELRYGARGTAVGWMQGELNRTINAGLKVDDDWGDKTQTAVGDFQRVCGLTQDFVAGHETNAALQL